MSIAIRNKGEVQIQHPVTQKIYVFRPSVNSLAKLETLVGKRTPVIMQEALLGSLLAQQQLLWSYLQKFHGEEVDSFEKAGNLIDEIGLDVIDAKFNELNALTNEAAEKGGEGGDPQTAQAGTGDGSTSSLGVTA